MGKNTKQPSAPLHSMFTEVPPRYDIVNRIITLGMDRRWRRQAAITCLEGHPQQVLDLGCGTGDLTLELARLASTCVEITGLDYSEPMLERARKKAVQKRLAGRIKFIKGEATTLPFADSCLDCVCISFAFRNLTYKNPIREIHLAEVFRILRPGGRYIIVESSQPRNSVIRTLFRLYLRVFVRPIGTLLSGNGRAYRYLTESAAAFYSPDAVKELLLSAGFNSVTDRPLFFGASGLHVAEK